MFAGEMIRLCKIFVHAVYAGFYEDNVYQRLYPVFCTDFVISYCTVLLYHRFCFFDICFCRTEIYIIVYDIIFCSIRNYIHSLFSVYNFVIIALNILYISAELYIIVTQCVVYQDISDAIYRV